MNEMADSIKKHGVLTPAVVRKKDDGRYELISGHRRKKACEIAGIDFLPAVVREMLVMLQRQRRQPQKERSKLQSTQ